MSLEPKALLTAGDFEALSTDVDGYFATHNALTGIVLNLEHMPGWAKFPALLRYMKFVASHYHRVTQIAVLTDQPTLKWNNQLRKIVVTRAHTSRVNF